MIGSCTRSASGFPAYAGNPLSVFKIAASQTGIREPCALNSSNQRQYYFYNAVTAIGAGILRDMPEVPLWFPITSQRSPAGAESTPPFLPPPPTSGHKLDLCYNVDVCNSPRPDSSRKSPRPRASARPPPTPASASPPQLNTSRR